MQNPVFIQFKDFLKRSNSMVSIPTENIRIRKYKTFQIFMRLAHMLIPQTPRQIMKYFRVINSKLCTQYQSDFLVFSHARTYCPICVFDNLIQSHRITTDCLQSNLDCLGFSGWECPRSARAHIFGLVSGNCMQMIPISFFLFCVFQ